MSDHKTPERKEIVKARLKAKQIWTSINLPENFEKLTRDEDTGERNTHTIPLTETKEHLEKIGDQIFRLNTNKHYVAISSDDPRRISYAKEQEHKFDSKRRTRTTLIKYVGKTFPELKAHMNEQALELFGSSFRAEATGATNFFHTVRGEDILEYYKDSYAEATCMTGCHSHLVKIYVRNKICSLLCYEDDDYIARALLWETDQGDKILDRIYPNAGPHIEAYKQYCNVNRIIMRTHQGYPRTDFSSSGKHPGNPVTNGKEYSITLTRRNLKRMPYMDTFTWGAYTGPGTKIKLFNKPYNSLIPPGQVTFYCTSTTGARNEWTTRDCYYCQDPIETNGFEIDGHYIWCGDCYTEHFTLCVNCDLMKRKSRMRTTQYLEQINTTWASANEYRLKEIKYCSDCTEDNTQLCIIPSCDNRYRIPITIRRALAQNGYSVSNEGQCLTCQPITNDRLNRPTTSDQSPITIKEESC